MDYANLSSELIKISLARQKIDEFSVRLRELLAVYEEAEATRCFIAECEKMSTELDNERKSHADELRQINQDINHLEDTLKGVKGNKDSKKEIIARKYDEIERELRSTNQLLRESGVPEEELLSREQFLPLIEDELFSLCFPLILHSVRNFAFNFEIKLNETIIGTVIGVIR
uniref:C4H2-type domain-containing protein n=1 Tax=Parascaris univalens TaxID=6257 RepID=A0A915BVT8_PARUN